MENDVTEKELIIYGSTGKTVVVIGKDNLCIYTMEGLEKKIWDWTWGMLKSDRLHIVEDNFGKKFSTWALLESRKLTEDQGDSDLIPIYSGSLK